MPASGALRFALWSIVALAAPYVLFALAGWLGSAFPRNADWREPADGIAILIASNGVHTEIVMPLEAGARDWRQTFPAPDIAASQQPYTHVSVSWGERAFFLETSRWSDLDPITAARALIGGEAVLHVAHYADPQPAEDQRVLRLRPAEYAQLTRQIARHVAPGVAVLPGYGTHDAFYSARGSYHLGNTCNQWTSDRLAAAGVRTGLWTPFPGGVMKWVPAGSGSPD